MLATAFLCCVNPMAQQKITRSDSIKIRRRFNLPLIDS
jgi:hypothetical protein